MTASAAEFTPDHKVYILGGDFDTLTAAEFPVGLPNMTLVFKVMFDATECGKPHDVRVELWDPDGAPVADPPFQQQIQPQRNSRRPTRQVGAQFGLNLQQVIFPRPGDYAFHIL